MLSADRCYRNEQQCDNGWCLLTKTQKCSSIYNNCPSEGSFWCDGYNDCPDESDETHCNRSAATTTPAGKLVFSIRVFSKLWKTELVMWSRSQKEVMFSLLSLCLCLFDREDYSKSYWRIIKGLGWAKGQERTDGLDLERFRVWTLIQHYFFPVFPKWRDRTFLDIKRDHGITKSCEWMFMKFLGKKQLIRFWDWSRSASRAGYRVNFFTFPTSQHYISAYSVVMAITQVNGNSDLRPPAAS